MLLVNSVAEFSSKDIELSLECIAAPSNAEVLLVNFVMELPLKDIWLCFEHIVI